MRRRLIGSAARTVRDCSMQQCPYDPDDPMGKMFFNILATFAEFEVDLIRMRTLRGWPLRGHRAS